MRAMLRCWLISATVLALGCPSHGPAPEHPQAADDSALRIQVARAEARRAAGVAELRQLVATGDAHAKALALRGLGRIGGDEAVALVRAHVGDPDGEVATAAYAALGVAAALDDAAPLEGEVALPSRMTPAQAVVVFEAFGRAAGVADQAAIVAAAQGQPAPVLASAELALGRMGRRKLAYQPAARAWLISLAAHADRDVRYAATYALAREHEPQTGTDAVAALAKRVSDDDPEIRATAIAGLAKRDAVAAAATEIADSLRDRDWRVAVEAVRALGGDHGTPAGRDLVASNLARRIAELDRGDPREAQIVIESLHVLIAHAAYGETAVAALRGLPVPAHAGLARAWITELAAAALAVAPHATEAEIRAARAARTGDKLADPQRASVLGELFEHGDVTSRRADLRWTLEHRDVRVRAVGLTILAQSWKLAEPSDRDTIVATLAAALGSADPVLSGTASDAIGTVYDAIGDDPRRTQLDTALVARAAREPDPELASALFEAIGTYKIAAGASACRAGLAGHPVRARAAATCLKALGQAVPTPAIAAAEPPPVDVATVIGKRITWHVTTSAGELEIELRPDVSPWSVATIVALTRKGFYDGLEFHRVVPDFVVQGGDPTMSGVGGPGFTTPAEPATALDGPGFAAGGVGIADAGRDSGGSQWFVMHSRAPHLDGRYTYIGRIVRGQNSADSLLIGDRIVKATVDVH
jgi:peptidyl-prolyl cis-trans isomerase B (cyclophilin B)